MNTKTLTERALTIAYNEHDRAEFGAVTLDERTRARVISRVRRRKGARSRARVCAVIEKLWYRFDS